MSKPTTPSQQEFISRLDTVLEERYSDENFGVRELARSMALSRSQLHRKMKATVGKSVSTYLKEFRLLKAKSLLQSGTLTVAEAGYLVGFGNPSYFNYSFSKYYGYPPGQVKYQSIKVMDLNHQQKTQSGLSSNHAETINSLPAKSDVSGWNFNWKRIIPAGLILVAGILFIVLLQGSLLKTEYHPTASQGENSLAVLPFVNLGSDLDGEYFAQGVRYEILDHLSHIKELNVKSRLVVDRLQEQGTSIDELVATLELTHYLEASINKVGDQIRIIIHLTDAQTKDQIWSEGYYHNYQDLLATQSEIAEKVAEALRINISPETAQLIKKKPTNNPMAWDDYLKATHYWRRYTVLRKSVDLERTVHFLKASIQKDPDFALGYSSLAMAYQQVPNDPNITFDFISPDSVLILCNLAIEMDPSLSDPYLRKAHFYTYYQPDSVAAIKNYKASIANGPHLAEPYWRFGNFYLSQRWDVATALKLIFQGLQKQPDSWLLARMLNSIGFIYLEIADYNKAEYYYDKALVYDPEDFNLIQSKAYLYSMTLEHDKQLAQLQKIMEISPLNRGLMGLGMYYMMVEDYAQSVKYFEEYYSRASETASVGVMHQNHNYAYSLKKMGRLDEANEKLEISLDALRRATWDTDYDYAKIYAYRGMSDSAYYHLERYVTGDIRWGLSDHIEYDPLFESIRYEPRFQRAVAIAKNKVRHKREEVHNLELLGEIPTSFEELDL